METYNLISLADISANVRPCYADEQLADTCITEAQNVDLRSQLGDTLWSVLFTEGQSQRIVRLLDGCEFEQCGCNTTRLHFGLRRVLCYYAYARIVRSGTNVQTRFGMVAKTDEYSERTSLKERVAVASDALATADRYMADVVEFLRVNASDYPEYSAGGRMMANNSRFRMIGK